MMSNDRTILASTTFFVSAFYHSAHNILSSRVLSRNLYAKLDLPLNGKIIILRET
jgi:hypothetical protein